MEKLKVGQREMPDHEAGVLPADPGIGGVDMDGVRGNDGESRALEGRRWSGGRGVSSMDRAAGRR